VKCTTFRLCIFFPASNEKFESLRLNKYVPSCIQPLEVMIQYGKDYEFDAPVKLLEKHLHAMAQSVDEQLLVVSQVIAFNDKPVKNLKGLTTMVENCDDEFLKFDLEYQQIKCTRFSPCNFYVICSSV
ncbi:hypothetical protein S83_031090, partial [Arachis hypogaea]